MISRPLGSRGFESLSGDGGGGIVRAGDGCRRGDGAAGSFRLLRLRSRELMDRPSACSDPGDSVLLPPEKIDDGRLTSLSPASLPPYIEFRLLADCFRPRIPLAKVVDRGVGHSIGLFDPVETATDCLLSTSDTAGESTSLCGVGFVEEEPSYESGKKLVF